MWRNSKPKKLKCYDCRRQFLIHEKVKMIYYFFLHRLCLVSEVFTYAKMCFIQFEISVAFFFLANVFFCIVNYVIAVQTVLVYSYRANYSFRARDCLYQCLVLYIAIVCGIVTFSLFIRLLRGFSGVTIWAEMESVD